MSQQLPLVAVVGRPNVGKSTFFNRVIGGATAVVDDLPGVTRDRREATTSWVEVPFRFMDTGGLVPGTEDSMESAILTQAWVAVEEADLIIFLVDAKDGLTALDREIAQQLRPHAAKVLLVANKVEGPEREITAQEASSLGFGVPLLLSGQHGQGVGDVLDAIVQRIPRVTLAEDDGDVIRLALLGRPNVGKSSIANRLLGEERMIVHDMAGTTRDAIDAPFRFDGRDYVLIDTAGLRRRSHVSGIEYYSALRTQRSLERCHVAVLVLDATQPVAAQDARIAGMIRDAGKSMIFVLNKWDLVEKTTGTTETVAKSLQKKFPALAAAPILFTSAANNLRVSRIPPLARDLYEERTKHISTSRLNEVLQEATKKLQPPIGKNGRPLRFYYATQTEHVPPTFVVFANAPQDMPAAYRNYLLNTFRDQLGFKATPIRLSFRARKRA